MGDCCVPGVPDVPDVPAIVSERCKDSKISPHCPSEYMGAVASRINPKPNEMAVE